MKTSNAVESISDQGQKACHPALPKYPGKLLNDRPPQQVVGHCGSSITAPITSDSCSNPSFYRGTTCHRKWARRAAPPLLSHRLDESLLTYMAASHPLTRGVPIGFNKCFLVIRFCLFTAYGKLAFCMNQYCKYIWQTKHWGNNGEK
ncbi:hypothetical protein AVEN_34155-1 [Araneus ventricosus]|uniref:Uncharacterized protein n=1 Tax=Araneus ventricosus TaxID=182803 RepID=A0A4Y2UJ06_ARAVE|nr:hypothetical protein AVEN_67896-1 [Araneus ventricosus]GBO12888.1 hypothetical protein AVEN_34155-1 [Araneus ventricosus]